VARGAGAFAGYDALTTTLRQIIATERGEPSGVTDTGEPVWGIQPKEIARAAGRGAVVGGAMGTAGLAATGLGAAIGKAAEVGVLASVPPLIEGRPLTPDDVIDAGVLVGALSVAGAARRALSKPLSQRSPLERQLVSNLPPETRAQIAEEALRTASEIASERARRVVGRRPTAESARTFPVLGEARAETAPEAPEALPRQAEAGLARRGIEAVEAQPPRKPPGGVPVLIPPEELRPAEPVEARGRLRTAREIAGGPPETPQTPAERQGAAQDALRGERQRLEVAARLRPYLGVPSTFREFVQGEGRRWPLTPAEPGYMALRQRWDELRKPIYGIRGPVLGKGEVLNRVTGEVEAQAPSPAMAQMEANRLDAAGMRPLPAEEFRRVGGGQLPTMVPIRPPAEVPRPVLEPAHIERPQLSVFRTRT